MIVLIPVIGVIVHHADSVLVVSQPGQDREVIRSLLGRFGAHAGRPESRIRWNISCWPPA